MFEGNSTSNDLISSGYHFGMVSPRVSDFFEGNSTSKSLIKFFDHQTSPSLGLVRMFLDGLTESVRLTANSFIVKGSISLVWLTWEASCFANFFALF